MPIARPASPWWASGIAVERRTGGSRRAGDVEQDGAAAAAVDRADIDADQDEDRLLVRHREGERRHQRDAHRGGQPRQRPDDDAEERRPEDVEDAQPLRRCARAPPNCSRLSTASGQTDEEDALEHERDRNAGQNALDERDRQAPGARLRRKPGPPFEGGDEQRHENRRRDPERHPADQPDDEQHAEPGREREARIAVAAVRSRVIGRGRRERAGARCPRPEPGSTARSPRRRSSARGRARCRSGRPGRRRSACASRGPGSRR